MKMTNHVGGRARADAADVRPRRAAMGELGAGAWPQRSGHGRAR